MADLITASSTAISTEKLARDAEYAFIVEDRTKLLDLINSAFSIPKQELSFGLQHDKAIVTWTNHHGLLMAFDCNDMNDSAGGTGIPDGITGIENVNKIAITVSIDGVAETVYGDWDKESTGTIDITLDVPNGTVTRGDGAAGTESASLDDLTAYLASFVATAYFAKNPYRIPRNTMGVIVS